MINYNEIMELILSRFGNKSIGIKAISDVLCVSEATVRNWLYHKTEPPLSKFMEMIEKFSIKPAELFRQGIGYVYFKRVDLVRNTTDSYLQYINGLAAMLEYTAEYPDARLIFAADEIPIFHFVGFPKLIYFKLYCYAYEMGMVSGVKFESFCEELDQLALEPVFERIGRAYGRIESLEIWDVQAVDTLLHYIDFMATVGYFADATTAQMLLDDLVLLIGNFRELALSGKKPGGGKFEFLKKLFPVGIGRMMLQVNGKRILTIKTGTINSMSTEDKGILDEFENILRASINNSIVLGVGAEKERTLYFKGLSDKIDAVRHRLPVT